MIIKTGIIPQVAFELFGVPIYWYAILMVTGMALAILLCRLYNGKFGVKFEDIFAISNSVSYFCKKLT